MPNSPIPFTNLPMATLLSGDELVPIVQGGTNKTARAVQLAFGSTSTLSFSSLTVGALEVTSSATIEALTVSSNILGLNAIVSNLAAISTATFEAATVSSNFSALNSSFTTLTVSGSATFSSTVTFAAATVSSNLSVLNASIATLDVSSSAVIESLSVSSNVTLGSSTSTLILNQTAMTRPNMPAFFAVSTGGQANATGNSTSVTIAFGAELYDRASNYSTATNIFTPPVTGIYNLSGSVRLVNFTSNHDTIQVNITAGSVVYIPDLRPATALTSQNAIGWSIQANLVAGSTVSVAVQVNGSSSGLSIVGSTISPVTWFAGNLVG